MNAKICKIMKKEVFEFICPIYFLEYILNGDQENLTNEEVRRINNVLSGYCCFSVSEDSFFTYKNDFFNLGANCVTLTAVKHD